MPAVFIDNCSQIKEILRCLSSLPPHNWLISELNCYDYCGWDGGEKWAEETLFLPDALLRRDIEHRDPQIIWGAFSALPINVTEEDAYACALPWLDGNSSYMRNHIQPQHPLAFLEIAVFDGSYVTVSACDAALLDPLYTLPLSVRDEEEDNQRLNANLRRIQNALKAIAHGATKEQVNEVQWLCWRKLFCGTETQVDDTALLASVKETFDQISKAGYRCKYSLWDPFDAG